jgi:rod shape-determining protein MreD
VSKKGGARTLEPWRWLGVPMLQVMAISFLFAIPLRFWGVGLPEPLFALPVVFAWAVIRPSMLAPVCVMLLGIYLDFLWGSRTGFWAVCLLIPYGAAIAGRTMLAGQGRAVYWAWYGAVCAIAMGSGYLFTMLDVKGTVDLVTVGWQFLATIVLYPFADRLIERFEDADVRFR